MIKKFVLSLFGFKNEEEFRAWVEAKFLEAVKIIGVMVANKVIALLPVVVAAGQKYFADFLNEKFNQVFPGSIPDVDKEIPEMVDNIREDVNQMPDVDIPGISDAFESITGIDVSEMLKDFIGKKE